MCWLCVGTPAIKPTNVSALRAGIALMVAGIVEVAGQVVVLSVAVRVELM